MGIPMRPNDEMVMLKDMPGGEDNILDDAAFETFFKKYFAPLCAHCQFKFGFELEKAKDAVHDSFMRLWEARESLSATLSLKAYLYKTLTNICIDIIKHQKVAGKKEKYLIEITQADSLENGFVQADYKQLGADIEQAISELPEQMRKVFLLCRYEGLKYAEVASLLGISPKTVENQMSRALAKLRQKLSSYQLLVLLLISVSI